MGADFGGLAIADEFDARQARLAQNESVSRALNERVEEAAKRSGPMFTEFVCECSRVDCMERVPLTIEEYEEVRKAATRFVVHPGHVAEGIEVVVDSGEDRYLVVEKVGEAARIAADLDPR